ncbi:MAG TPA: TonB-dependent receptor [Chitinophagaceae bacterium]|nr:TonB-dependent receptor [Chitinophagaceae bacterium]
MRKSYRYLTAGLIAVLFTISAYAQSVTVSGTVRNESTKEIVPAVTVALKENANQGTYTDQNGVFSLKVPKLPTVLVVSSIGFESQEITVTSATQVIEVSLKINSSFGQEVVVAATRSPQRLLESPVTVERLSAANIKSLAAPTIYESIGNLKGVDVHTASLTFRTVTTRGFVSSGNTRLNQLVDGMDNQAPGLNFAVSTIVGLTDLDVDNIEILSGASSALYGSGGMNGTVLINSKSPFKYQGLSYNVKQGIMHVDSRQRRAAPYNNISMRWAKVINNKLAFRLSGELIRGNDWEAEDYRNKQQIGILSKVVGGNRQNDPNYNGVNVYGDETSVNLNQLAAVLAGGINSTVLAQTSGALNLQNQANAYYASIGNPLYPTTAQNTAFISALPAAVQQTAGFWLPFYLGLSRNYFGTQTNVTRTGYNEDQLVDYNTINAKLNVGVHYKLTEKIEASFNTYFGTGTTVYTGANRYSLRGFKMAQHKAELKSKNWMVRGYTIQENAGDSYIGDALGTFINEAWKPSVNNANLSGSWFPQYIYAFSEGRRQSAGSLSDIQLHLAARGTADAGRFLPGSAAFNNAAAIIKKTPVSKAGGALFLDKSDLYVAEGQLNLSEVAHFSDVVDLLVGASWKQWVMNSQGTLFADTNGNIRVNEHSGYIQLKKKLFNDVLTMTASGRFDKQTNFKGKFTPRVTAVFKVANESNIRLSYQTAYRFPTNQNQYISLQLGGGSSYLIGCLPEFQSYYKLSTTKPGYTAASILAYRAGATSDSSRLVRAVYKEVKPETMNSYEIGYKGVVAKKLLVDAYVYYSRYKDFLLSEAVGQSQSEALGKLGLYSPFSTNNLSYVQNSSQTVKSIGWGIGLEYKAFKNYVFYGNVFSDELRDVPAGTVTFFNAPKYRFNIGLRNESVFKGIGFNVVAKWQDNNYYEGTFVSGTLPYFTWVDAQITYHPIGTKATFRIGGTNLGNNYYRTGYGSPAVGGLYYISYGYNLF